MNYVHITQKSNYTISTNELNIYDHIIFIYYFILHLVLLFIYFNCFENEFYNKFIYFNCFKNEFSKFAKFTSDYRNI